MLRLAFLSDVARLIRDWAGCDAVEVRMVERQRLWCAEASEEPWPPRCGVLAGRRGDSGRVLPCRDEDTDLENLCEEIVEGRADRSLPWFTVNGTFWTGDITETFRPDPTPAAGPYRSFVVTPYEVEDGGAGLVVLKSGQRNHFLPDQMGSFEHVARILVVAAKQRRAQLALRERVKELTCLYGIARIAARPGVMLEQILQKTAELIPKGCLHDELASAAVVFDDRWFCSGTFEEGPNTHTQDIVVEGKKRGAILLTHAADLPELDVGPFITEELDLLELVAGELTLVIEAREVEEQRSSLEDQLRHADRLATIGQLAAGVAHELNEPLVTVLGCAQLSRKTPGLPEQAKADYERIIAASLHARDVISKLKLFARRAPARKEESDLNEVVRDGLALLEEHVEKSGITLEARLDSELPTVVADRGQLHQVLINLIVNALQATEPGGRITVRTMPGEAAIVLVVQDTGSGMAEETLKHIFTPFFTTKEVDEGTGLGLSVVHGIVSAHGGTIQVKSRVGAGSRFEVRLPVTSAERTDPSGVDEIAQQ
jgi:signal transduction histidine kinase